MAYDYDYDYVMYVDASGELVWIPGYWDYDAGEWYWVDGYWTALPAGYYWQPGYWQPYDGSYRRIAGRWVARSRVTDHRRPRVEVLDARPDQRVRARRGGRW